METQVKQRGSGFAIYLVFLIYKMVGYNIVYYLLYPISLFYFLFASNVRQSLKIYYANLGQNFSNRILFHHIRIFAICLLDRFISSVEPENYKFEVDPDEEANILEKTKNGGIFLLSHFGGWAVASNAFSKYNLNMNIVMKEASLKSIQKFENSLKSEKTSKIKVIDINEGGISVSLKIAEALNNQELVSIMGDRYLAKNSAIEFPFLGKRAFFNKNPFIIAYKLRKPILILFIVYKEKKMYKIESEEIPMDWTFPMEESISKSLNVYVTRLANTSQKYPNQWFNFYNFWSLDEINN